MLHSSSAIKQAVADFITDTCWSSGLPKADKGTVPVFADMSETNDIRRQLRFL